VGTSGHLSGYPTNQELVQLHAAERAAKGITGEPTPRSWPRNEKIGVVVKIEQTPGRRLATLAQPVGLGPVIP